MNYPFFVPGIINTEPVTMVPVGAYVTPTSVVTSEISVSVTTDKPVRTETFRVSSLPSTNYYLPTSLYYVADPITYNYPVYRSISYLDVNADKDLHKKMTRYYFSQLYNKYVPEDHPRLLNFVKLSAKDIELVKSVNEAKNINTKEDEFGEKISYLADYVYTKQDIYRVLNDYCDRKNIKWWDLKYYSDDLEDILIKDLEETIKDKIVE